MMMMLPSLAMIVVALWTSMTLIRSDVASRQSFGMTERGLQQTSGHVRRELGTERYRNPKNGKGHF